jgi:UDP-N-acetyl-2-amino-2-deoxyglucuronate dehydrogenase
MLTWIFGPVKQNIVHVLQADKAAGYLDLEKARVKWFLSLDYNDIPENVKESGKRTYRSITLNNEAFEFSEGFTDLHTASYNHILEGKGFGIYDSKQAIDIVYTIRNNTPIGLKGEFHPMCAQIKK